MQRESHRRHESRESIGTEHWEHCGTVTPSTPDREVKRFIFQREDRR